MTTQWPHLGNENELASSASTEGDRHLDLLFLLVHHTAHISLCLCVWGWGVYHKKQEFYREGSINTDQQKEETKNAHIIPVAITIRCL